MLLQELLNVMEQSGEDITGMIDALLCNTPYNTRPIAGSAVSDYDRLGLKDMSIFSIFCRTTVSGGE